MDAERIILASGSPRRRELLEQIGVRYCVSVADIDETALPGELPDVYAARLALEKARAVHGENGSVVLGADTVVVLDERALGKPADRAHAIEMLTALSGRSHVVISAIAVLCPDGQALQAISETHVTFTTLTQEEIEAFCDKGEPMDKAGAYGIQGMAAVFISAIEGSYSGVMGLPLFETAQLLRRAGIQITR